VPFGPDAGDRCALRPVGADFARHTTERLITLSRSPPNPVTWRLACASNRASCPA